MKETKDEGEEREMKIITKYYLPATVVLPSREAYQKNVLYSDKFFVISGKYFYAYHRP